jgi:tryptophanyl-tRNA synthetase
METVSSGIQPSGKLHLGNYLGAVRSWVESQGRFRCFYCFVDDHDPARVKRTDPGTPAKCNIFTLHRFFSDEARQAEIQRGCTTAGIGCIDCKKLLFEGVKTDLAQIQTRAEKLRAEPERVDAILARGISTVVAGA